jgi:hypothetical protein
MILADVDVLVHAHNADPALHDRARLWRDASLSGTEGIWPRLGDNAQFRADHDRPRSSGAAASGSKRNARIDPVKTAKSGEIGIGRV